MKSNELRIGNYFKWSEFASMGQGIDIVTEQNMFSYLSLKEPIPLTEEWLLKLGLKKTNQTSPYSYYIGNEKQKPWRYLRLQYATLIDVNNVGNKISGYNALFLNNKLWDSVRYVNQLQNLYFALTGQELTINN